MPKLVYFAIASLDGYIEDEHGRFDWAAPDEEVHAVVKRSGAPFGLFLYGRRMYETVAVWETMTEGSPAVRDFGAIWSAGVTPASGVPSWRRRPWPPGSSASIT